MNAPNFIRMDHATRKLAKKALSKLPAAQSAHTYNVYVAPPAHRKGRKRFLLGLLVGVGAAVALSESLREDLSRIFTRASDQTVDKAHHFKDQAVHKAHEVKDQATEKVQEVKEQATDKTQEVKEKVKDVASEKEDEAQETADEAKNKAAEKVQHAAQKAQERAEEAQSE